MAHYAKIANGIVQQVIVADEEVIKHIPGKWILTSYSTRGNAHPHGAPLRGNFASPGWIYNEEHDVFYSPQPGPNFTLNTNTWTWEVIEPLTLPY